MHMNEASLLYGRGVVESRASLIDILQTASSCKETNCQCMRPDDCLSGSF
jgi:hypothetical protein